MSETFTPAAGLRVLTPLYDIAVRLGLRERQLRDQLLVDAAIEPGMHVLDLACGTGTLAILVKSRVPSCDVSAIDIDEDVLAIARRKAERAGVTVRFERQAITEPLTRFAPVDRVLCSLVMHHLDPLSRVRALRSARTALAPEGRVHVVDFGPPSSRRMRLAFYGVQLLDGFATTRDSVRGTMPEHLRAVGLHDVRETRHLDTMFGTVRFWEARAEANRQRGAR
jgi:ubiquinone/menaquinone biosynthesis C-methylase UbiE